MSCFGSSMRCLSLLRQRGTAWSGLMSGPGAAYTTYWAARRSSRGAASHLIELLLEFCK